MNAMPFASFAAAALLAQPAPDAPTLREVFPHIRIDVTHKVVEFDAKAAVRFEKVQRGIPRVYLEQIVCTPDTKEHESLVVTDAKPSHVHAALLSLGLEPGTPAAWRTEDATVIPIAPTGPGITIEFIYKNTRGETITEPPSAWILNARTGERWPQGSWVFAGSLMKKHKDRELYLADSEGTLIGLTSFGTEVLAWPRLISPDSQVDEPLWAADAARVPPADTAVVVRLTVMPE